MNDMQCEQIKNVIINLQTGIPFLDNDQNLKERVANLAISIFKSQSPQESLKFIKNFRLFYGPIPEIGKILTKLKDRISILENTSIFEEIEFILTEYSCFIAAEKIRRKLRKPILDEIGFNNPQSINHPAMDFLFKTFLSKLSFKDIPEAVELFAPFNELFNNLDDDFITPKDLSKTGRKDQALEQEFVFNLKQVLKKYDGEYMNNLILILEEIKSLSPEIFADLPYLNPDSLRKSIERGSKLKSYKLTLND